MNATFGGRAFAGNHAIAHDSEGKCRAVAAGDLRWLEGGFGGHSSRGRHWSSLLFFSNPSNSMPGMNEWLMIRNLRADSCKQLLIGRCDVRHGPRDAANWPGNGAVRKR
jgi:hypothetical protein